MDTTQALMDALKGANVVISGTTVSGSEVKRRTLQNITIKREKGHFWVVGFCPIAKGVRQFRMDLLDEMVALPEHHAGQGKVAS